ncbi:MAG: ATP-binding protein, partial [Burkholderiales bacterium]|nr:ATP-binding protein [Burkholderiales bacterium]
PQGWLILIGGYGCGKTHLAAAIANERIALNQSALFVIVPDLLDHLRATYSPTSEVTYDQRFETVRTAPLLILDDLGTENTTAWANEKLYQILNYRYNAQMPTVITTNHRLEEIDVRLRSRMSDPDICQVYTI